MCPDFRFLLAQAVGFCRVPVGWAAGRAKDDEQLMRDWLSVAVKRAATSAPGWPVEARAIYFGAIDILNRRRADLPEEMFRAAESIRWPDVKPDRLMTRPALRLVARNGDRV